MVGQTGVRFGLANGAIVLALLAAGMFRLDLAATTAVALFGAAAVSTRLPVVLAPVMGLVSWAWFTGFFVNGYGVLTFGSRDLLDLAGFVAVSVVVGLLARLFGTTASGRGARE